MPQERTGRVLQAASKRAGQSGVGPSGGDLPAQDTHSSREAGASATAEDRATEGRAGIDRRRANEFLEEAAVSARSDGQRVPVHDGRSIKATANQCRGIRRFQSR